MRFPRNFKRYVGTLPSRGKELGADKPPSSAPMTNDDNQLALRALNVNGFTVQRIVVGCHAPDGAPPLTARVFVHDDGTGRWFATEARELVAGCFSFFDVPVLGDNPNVDSREAGPLEVCVVVDKPKKPVDGEYLFVIGGDVSSPA